MTGYKSKRAAAQAKLVVTDIDGHIVRDVRKSKKTAMRDKLEDDDTLTIVYQSGYYDGKKAAQPAQEPIGYAVPTFDFDNSVIKKVHYSRTVPLYTSPPQRQKAVFPTMLRKMWSGSEVQAWLDENVNKENT